MIFESCKAASLMATASGSTGYFSSQQIHCPLCQVKEHKNGTVTYEHQMLAAVIVHLDLKEVIPLVPEPIQKQDVSTKNDCERNAARRLLQKTRQEHPRLKLIVVEDGYRFRPWTAPKA